MAELDPFEPDDSDDESEDEHGAGRAPGSQVPPGGAKDDDSEYDVSDEPVECTISIAKVGRHDMQGEPLYNAPI